MIGQTVLHAARRRYPDAAQTLADWLQVATAAEWQSLADVRWQYPSADGVKLKSGAVITVFNIGGKKYRLLCAIVYRRQTVTVLEVLTHAEYNKDQWKRRY